MESREPEPTWNSDLLHELKTRKTIILPAMNTDRQSLMTGLRAAGILRKQKGDIGNGEDEDTPNNGLLCHS